MTDPWMGRASDLRVCICGCGLPFRVFKTSTQLHASRSHELDGDIRSRRQDGTLRKGIDPPPGYLRPTVLAVKLGISLNQVHNYRRDGRFAALEVKHGYAFNEAQCVAAHAEIKMNKKSRKKCAPRPIL